jgi:hypothetical protein
MSGVPVNIQRRQVSADSNTRTSGYFILINSNKQRNTLTQAAADSYRAAVEQFVQGHFRTCIRFVGDDGASWSKKWINKVDISYAHERGPKGNSLHTHMLLRLTHTTKVRLDYKAVWAYMKQHIPGCYVSIRLCKLDSLSKMQNYIYKGQRPAEERQDEGVVE